MRALIVALTIVAGNWAAAERGDPFFITPHVAVGFNSQQGTAFILGLDAGMKFGDGWRGGVTSHYSAGEKPEYDREYGAGVFAGYAQQFGDMFVAHAREEIGYLDVRNPIDPEPVNDPKYEHEKGVASTTSIGLTLYFTPNFALTGGYRFVLGISDSDLGDGRSGPTAGIVVGI